MEGLRGALGRGGHSRWGDPFLEDGLRMMEPHWEGGRGRSAGGGLAFFALNHPKLSSGGGRERPQGTLVQFLRLKMNRLWGKMSIWDKYLGGRGRLCSFYCFLFYIIYFNYFLLLIFIISSYYFFLLYVICYICYICYMLNVICYILHAICYILCYMLFIIHYLSFTIYYLLFIISIISFIN